MVFYTDIYYIMNINFSLILIHFVSLLYLAGCSASSGTVSVPGANNAPEETGFVQDEELGIVAGLNLDDNISEEESITVNGEIEWIEGLDGQALYLDSDGEFLSLPDSDNLDLIGGGSVSVWVKPVENTSFAGILHKGVETNFSDEAWSMQYWTGYRPSMLIYNGAGTSRQITASAALELDKWHHIAATWGFDPADGKDWFRFYTDGVKEGELDISSFMPLKNSAGDLIIGSQLPEQYNTTYGHLTFRGAIDNILIFDHPLTEAELTDLYNEFSGM